MDEYPIGSIAILAAPYPVDTGIYSAGKTVDKFIKRSAGGGRWVSYPGSDVYYTTLAGLKLDADVIEVIVPETGDPENVPDVEPDPGEVVPVDEIPGFDPADAAPAETAGQETFRRWVLPVAIAVGGYFLLRR